MANYKFWLEHSLALTKTSSSNKPWKHDSSYEDPKRRKHTGTENVEAPVNRKGLSYKIETCTDTCRQHTSCAYNTVTLDINGENHFSHNNTDILAKTDSCSAYGIPYMVKYCIICTCILCNLKNKSYAYEVIPQ